MKRSFVKALLVGTALQAMALVAPQAGAADVDPKSGLPFYVSVFAGLSNLKSVDAYWYHPALTYDYLYSFKSKSGYLLGGAVGTQLNDYLRVEAELSHATSKAKSVYSSYYAYYSSSDGIAPARGTMKSTYLLANLWLDLKNNSPFTPYVGGGVGFGWANAGMEYADGTTIALSGTDSGFAYQLGGGIKFDLNEHLGLDAGYRYKVLDDLEFTDKNVPTAGAHYYDANVRSHNFQIGLTYTF